MRTLLRMRIKTSLYNSSAGVHERTVSRRPTQIQEMGVSTAGINRRDDGLHCRGESGPVAHGPLGEEYGHLGVACEREVSMAIAQ